MRRPHPLHTLGCIWRNLAAERRARRTYRALCDEGRAPLVSVDIRLELDHGDDWSDLKAPGMSGLKTSGIPLTPRGIRYIDDIPRSIRRLCLDELRRIDREETR